MNQATAVINEESPITVTFPKLKTGELWVGLIISADGSKREHVILLPGDSDPANWSAQVSWAESIGGYLPDRCEQAMLYKFMKEHFKNEWYWSGEQHASYSLYAWSQNFDHGDQDDIIKYNEFRARAVRRLPI